jgi:uncharacterized protein involved in outer membrane biogenesis
MTLTDAQPPRTPVPRSRWLYLGGSIAILGIALLALVSLWDWNWFRPLVEARVSAVIGRAVTMERLEVRPGHVTGVTAHGVMVANPPGFETTNFVTIPRLSLTFEPVAWWRSGRLVLHTIEVDRPDIDIQQTGTGLSNWIVPGGTATAVEVGSVAIENGTAHIHVVREQSDVTISIATSHTGNGDVLIVNGKGTHARQPITFHAVGGALLSLRDSTAPYPIDRNCPGRRALVDA